MTFPRIIASALVAFTLLSAGPPAAVAQPEQDRMYEGLQKGRLIPYGRIARQIEARYQGRIVGQRVRQTGPEQWIYELRLLRGDGQVMMVIVDAQTGRIIRTTGGR